MSKKERCKQLMAKFFGPQTASLVDDMSEEDCVYLCRDKISNFLGEDAARDFDRMIAGDEG